MTPDDLRRIACTLRTVSAYLSPEVQKLRRHLRQPSNLIKDSPEGEEVARHVPKLFDHWLREYAGTRVQKDGPKAQYARFWEWLTDDAYGYERMEARDVLGLGEEDMPSILFFEEASAHPRPIVKNEWLVHFTKDALAIARRGFIRGVPDHLKLGLTTRLPEEMKAKGGFNFGYSADTKRFIDDAQRGWAGWRFGDEVVVFRANGYRIWHRTDEQVEIIFWGKTARDIVPVKLLAGGWCVLTADGRPVFRSRTSGDDGLWRCVKWVKANFDQYRRVLK